MKLVTIITITHLYASQGGSCCVKPIPVLHLTLDKPTSPVTAHFTRSGHRHGYLLYSLQFTVVI